EAGPPSAAYRLIKFAKRHRGALTTAAAFLALMVAGAAISAWQAVRASRAELQAVAGAGQARGGEIAGRGGKNTACAPGPAEERARREAEAATRQAESARREAQLAQLDGLKDVAEANRAHLNLLSFVQDVPDRKAQAFVIIRQSAELEPKAGQVMATLGRI